jgi:Restriction endonuclease
MRTVPIRHESRLKRNIPQGSSCSLSMNCLSAYRVARSSILSATCETGKSTGLVANGRLDQVHIGMLLRKGSEAQTTKEKGDALEALICYLFQTIPGITVTRRNERNTFDTKEIDVAFFNEQTSGGLPFPPWIILVECKNWLHPVGSEHVSWFDTKMRNRGVAFGILVAANGITGNPALLTDAHSTIANALKERRLIVITVDEIKRLAHSSQLVHLIKEKLCDLAVKGTIL